MAKQAKLAPLHAEKMHSVAKILLQHAAMNAERIKCEELASLCWAAGNLSLSLTTLDKNVVRRLGDIATDYIELLQPKQISQVLVRARVLLLHICFHRSFIEQACRKTLEDWSTEPKHSPLLRI